MDYEEKVEGERKWRGRGSRGKGKVGGELERGEEGIERNGVIQWGGGEDALWVRSKNPVPFVPPTHLITLGKLFCPPASVSIWINEGAEQKLTWGQEAAESLKPMGRGCLVASPLGFSLFP